ncbi:MAG: hypothetical protein ABIQ32_03465 [Sphingomicrobium sp.]
MSDEQTRRRWIGLGEIIGLAALVVSALGVWIAWTSSNADRPTRVVEQHQPIPLALRGKVQDNGRELVISPVESSHALESLNLFFPHKYPVELGSEGRLIAGTVEAKLAGKDLEKGDHAVKVGATVKYVEMGKDRTSQGDYVLHYRVEGGGLFGGRSVRLAGLSR